MSVKQQVWSVLDILQWSKDFLQEKGSPNPKHEAELLLMAVLGLERMDLYLQFDRPLTKAEKELYRSYILRRAKKEPVQYITGFTYFMGLRFEVNQSVLIPRFDTETLVEVFVKNFKQQVESGKNSLILDIGTGSGAIAVSLAKLLPTAKVLAVDNSEPALAVAAKNAQFNGVVGQVEFLRSDLLTELIHRDFSSSDVWLISNPPYISEVDYYTLDQEVRDFEPKQALLAQESGLEFYRKIIAQSAILGDKLKGLFFEVGYDQASKVDQMLMDRFDNASRVKDLGGIERVVYTYC